MPVQTAKRAARSGNACRPKPAQLELNFVPLSQIPLLTNSLPQIKQLFRVAEAALCLGVSDNQIRNLIDEGVLDARSISTSTDPERRHVRVTRASLVQFLNGTAGESGQR